MNTQLKEKIALELEPYIDEWFARIKKVKDKKGFATIQLNAKAIIQDGKVTQLTFNDEHLKIKEEDA